MLVTIVVNKDIYMNKDQISSIKTPIADYKLRITSVINYQNSNLSTTNLSANNTHQLLTTAPTHLSAAASGNLSAPTNSNTTIELTSKLNPKTEIDPTKLKIIDGSPSTNPQFLKPAIKINYLSLLVISKDTQLNNPETNQHPTLTSNILPATITENESLNAIFPFELEKLSTMPLFSGATLEEKPITAMYTDAKVDNHFIKLILDIDHVASTKIITTNKATKTSINKIDNFSIEVNGIIVLIKILHSLVMIDYPKPTCCLIRTRKSFKLARTVSIHIYQPHDELTWEWKKNSNEEKRKEKEKETTPINSIYSPYIYTLPWPSGYCQPKLSALDDQNNKESGITNLVSHHGETCNETYQYTILINNWVCKGTPIDNAWKRALRQLEGYSHNKHELWRMAYAKTEDTTTSELLEIKNNPLSLSEPKYVQTFNVFSNIEDNPEEFHKHYQ
ncbi:hypothetical protein G9A89_020414 [Geosiphon pyriformis]|nr:hypothetical protein G9A89_020414 [Geosiphon pyriformis]